MPPRAQSEHSASTGGVRGMVRGPPCQIFLGSCLLLLTGDGPAKRVGTGAPVSPPRPAPLTSTFSLCADTPLRGRVLALDLLIPPTRLQPNAAGFLSPAWKPQLGSGALGLDCCHLTHRLSGWATLGKHPRNLEKISMPGSFPRPTPPSPRTSDLIDIGCSWTFLNLPKTRKQNPGLLRS